MGYAMRVAIIQLVGLTRGATQDVMRRGVLLVGWCLFAD
jgi:hypothetical protein